MKHVLISGGTGLIGRHLIKALQANYSITVITRDPSRAARLLGSQVSSTTLDELTSLEPFDAVINLAGEPIADKRWSDTQKQKICQSRWDITQRLVDLINVASDKPDVFISGSAIGVYGRQDDKPINEDFTDFHEEFSREVCAKWEEIALKAQTRVCIARTGVVLEEDGGALAKMIMPFRLGLGGPIGDGKQYMSWIHIEDMVRGLIHLLENERCLGLFNLTSPNPNTNHFFSLKLAKRLERPCIFKVPAFVIKTLMGESSDLVLYGQKVVPERLINSGFSFNYPTLEDALSGLNL
jgi:uncharacterized protein (TIGR01777 family)